MKKNFRSIFAAVLVVVVFVVALTGCTQNSPIATAVKPNNSSTNSANADTSSENSSSNPANADTSSGNSNSKPTNTDVSKETTNNDVRWIGDWEVVIKYDSKGLVTDVVAYNDDTFQRESYSGYEGKDYNTVVDELVTAIKEAGYFVGEIDRERNHVTIEINNRYDRDDRYEDKYDDRYDWD